MLKQLYAPFSKDSVMSVAGGVTFYALLSIFLHCSLWIFFQEEQSMS
jgi:uncharacterized BrkB/YihY/UPF0761 family membrane protein